MPDPVTPPSPHAGGDEEQGIAALMHDAVEDAPDRKEAARRREMVRERFGDRVLGLVDACTDGDPAEKDEMSWEDRKRRYGEELEEVVATLERLAR